MCITLGVRGCEIDILTLFCVFYSSREVHICAVMCLTVVRRIPLLEGPDEPFRRLPTITTYFLSSLQICLLSRSNRKRILQPRYVLLQGRIHRIKAMPPSSHLRLFVYCIADHDLPCLHEPAGQHNHSRGFLGCKPL